MKPVLMIR